MPQSLISFIRAAKFATYAASGDAASLEPFLPNTKQLEFKNDNYLYRDIYAGMGFFVGQEIVYESEKVIWSMCYSGGILAGVEANVAEVYKFLRSALLQAPEHLPLRGPAALSAGELQYSCAVTGLLERFHGQESILSSGTPVYTLHFSGGVLS